MADLQTGFRVRLSAELQDVHFDFTLAFSNLFWHRLHTAVLTNPGGRPKMETSHELSGKLLAEDRQSGQKPAA